MPETSDPQDQVRTVTLFLCGDVMTGRGIDQVLPYPGNPRLRELYVESALDYVSIAERANGTIPRSVDPSYIWGDALEVLERMDPGARIINLETAVTQSDDFWPEKGIHYRMHPENISCLTAGGVDCCALANNHVLDWGYPGLQETLATLREAGLQGVGAGRNLEEAEAPAVIPTQGTSRILVFSFGHDSSGIPPSWAAGEERPGLNLLHDLSNGTLRRLGRQIETVKRDGDIVVASIHWGGNWGYDVPAEHRRFAHGLIDAGFDVIHGHSSHHPKGIEVYLDRPILYGCGDFINDYEGIGGHERFRSHLTVMYFPALHPEAGLVRFEMVPMEIRRFRLQRASEADARWLTTTLDRESRRFGCRVQWSDDGPLTLEWRE
jgi:poly-gamma-glutamate synthesis protein (capsule biosynthesis protein)